MAKQRIINGSDVNGAITLGTIVSGSAVTCTPEAIRSLMFPVPTGSPTCAIDIDTLRQIRILLRCIQQPVVAYDSDLVTMVQSAVGYCGEKAAEIEALLPQHGMLEDGE